MNDTYTHNIIITNKNNLFCFVGSQTKTDVLLLLINSISLLDLSNYNQKWPLHAVKIEPQNRECLINYCWLNTTQVIILLGITETIHQELHNRIEMHIKMQISALFLGITSLLAFSLIATL